MRRTWRPRQEVLCAWVWLAVLSGQSPVRAEPGEAPAAFAQAEAEAEVTDDTQEGDTLGPVRGPAPSVGLAGGADDVRAQLRATQAERDRVNLWLPWLSVAVGGGSAAIAGIAGALQVMTCHSNCDTLNWVAFTAVAGTSLATLATIWLIRAQDEVRALDSRKYHLEQELERIRLSRLSRDVTPARSGSLFSVRFVM